MIIELQNCEVTIGYIGTRQQIAMQVLTEMPISLTDCMNEFAVRVKEAVDLFINTLKELANKPVIEWATLQT